MRSGSRFARPSPSSRPLDADRIAGPETFRTAGALGGGLPARALVAA